MNFDPGSTPKYIPSIPYKAGYSPIVILVLGYN
jgi:hypothetical protein